MIIALQGKPGAGKSTVASFLVRQHAFVVHKIAKPLKDMLRVGFGLTDEHIEGALKDVPCDALGGRTPRYAMQTLGTEWRELMHPDLYLHAWRSTLPAWPRVVVDDCRFPNEVPFFRALDAYLIRIERPSNPLPAHAGPDPAQHPAETQVLDCDVVIMNDGDVAQLERRVFHALVSRSCA